MSNTVKQKCRFAVAIITFALFASWGMRAAAQTPAKPPTAAPKTAEQQFKNIQVLKDIPAEELIPDDAICLRVARRTVRLLPRRA